MDKDKERIRPSSKKTCDGNKMQPAAPKTDELDLLDQSQERVLEGLSISVPVQPLPKLAKPFWGGLLGTKVFLLLKDGIEISGILRQIAWDFIRLENFLEVGKNRRGSASWVMVDTSSVSRIYAANAEFEHTG